MNRLVCERKVNDPVDCLLEVKEQSSRTHGGVRGSPHQSLLVGQSTRLWAGFQSSILKYFPFKVNSISIPLFSSTD